MTWVPDGLGMDRSRGESKDFKIALALGRIPFIEEIIRRTGAGIDFENLEIELEAVKHETPSAKIEPPLYYSGLRIRGKFRRDWARASAPTPDVPYQATKVPIALLAAYHGNAEVINWMFSDGPKKAVERFVKDHRSDKRATMLEKVNWRERLGKWFGINFTPVFNAFHAAIRGQTTEGIDAVFDQFIKTGITPLMVLDSVETKRSPIQNGLILSAQFTKCFPNVLEKYVKYGGDLTAKDDGGYNVLHRFMFAATPNVALLKHFLSRLSDEQKATILISRISDKLSTPIALAVQSGRIDSVSTLLEHGTEQLHIRDGDGNLPIHIAVSKGYEKITRLLITADPSTLNVEDASGTIPIEIAQQRYTIYLTQTHPLGLSPKINSWTTSGHQPETLSPSYFLEKKTDVIEHENLISTFATVCAAMTGNDCGKRELISLLDVTDVVDRAVKRVKLKERDADPHVIDTAMLFW